MMGSDLEKLTIKQLLDLPIFQATEATVYKVGEGGVVRFTIEGRKFSRQTKLKEGDNYTVRIARRRRVQNLNKEPCFIFYDEHGTRWRTYLHLDEILYRELDL